MWFAPFSYPTPTTYPMEAMDLEAQLCFDSILMDLICWSRLITFPQRVLMGQWQGVWGISAQGAAQLLLTPIPSLGGLP